MKIDGGGVARRTIRGGSFVNDDTSYIMVAQSWHAEADAAGYGLGFRVASNP
jgi:hypothetical protein